jgi:hypothetical protein
MRPSRSLIGAFALALALLVSSLALGTASQASPAGSPAADPEPPAPPSLPPRIEREVSAQVGTQPRTFVASSGNDANLCTRPAPCRTFNRAISQTASGGEVVALDSAGYGPMTINQAIAIVGAPGAHVAIAVTSGTGIGIAAGASDKVILRNLYVNSQGAQDGIVWESGNLLDIENVVVNGFSANGIVHVAPGGVLTATDVVARNNDTGILVIAPTGALVRATLHRVQVEGSGLVGIWASTAAAGSTVRLAASDCVSTTNGWGIVVQGQGAGEVNVERCQVIHNGTAMATSDAGILRVSNSVIAFNQVGVFGAGTLSRGNNTVEGNTGGNGTFGGTFTAK